MNKTKKTILIDGWRDGVKEAEIELPVSKSLMIRQLMINALCGSKYTLEIDSRMPEDVGRMQSVLKAIDLQPANLQPHVLDCGNAGSVARMAAVYGAFRGGTYQITGSERLKERPAKELAAMLQQGGVSIGWPEREGFFPINISSTGFNNNQFKVQAQQSSQHISAMLLVGAYLKGGLTLMVSEGAVSRPYITMTTKAMEMSGINIVYTAGQYKVSEGKYKENKLKTMPDWSSAAFFYQAVSLAPWSVKLTLKNLSINGLQGDERASSLFQQLGVQTIETDRGIQISNSGVPDKMIKADFSNHPDLFNAFAVAAILLNKPVQLTGLHTLNYKESNRLEHLKKGLEKMGYRVNFDGIKWIETLQSKAFQEATVIDSEGDHRIAMSFAVGGLRHKIIITDSQVVIKSFPDFFHQLEKIAVIGKVPNWL